MTADKFLARLCALVPPPGFHMLRYYGVFASHHHLRACIVPAAAATPETQLALDLTAAANDTRSPTDASPRPRRLGWAKLLARVFAVDVTVCRLCGGRMRVLEVVSDPARVLHGARAPPSSSTPSPASSARAVTRTSAASARPAHRKECAAASRPTQADFLTGVDAMDANVHRAILKLAAERAKKRIQAEGKLARVDLESAFWALHQGNWLTDMNQATCFFDALEGRGDPYAALDIGKGKYSLPKSVGDHQGEWTSMFHELWAKECEGADLPVLPRGAGSREHERLNPQIIGGYYPMDHFDVVVGDVPAREAREFEGIGAKPAMTLTARSGIFEYAQSFWLYPAFRPGQDRADPFALRSVGHAAHILQDFFGHSNFVELLLMAAAKHENTLDDDLRAALAAERVGTFGAFWRAHPEDPAETPVMTGRFDRIDTLASLLGIYRRGLVHSWSDLDAGPHGGAPAATDDLLFDVVFGTFSDRPYTESARKAIVTLWKTRREFKALRETFRRGVLEVVASIATHFTGPEAKSSIQEVKELIQPADPKEARRYATAGRILYLECVIETKLRHEVTTAKSRALPHHTLLAKDHDVAHPEVRLAYKLACQLATDVTTDLLYHFAVGSSFDAVKELLQRYYRHPALHLEEQGVRAALRQRTDRLYGVRWWLAAAADEPLLAGRD